MDRNELAARLLTALYTAPGQIDEATCVKWAVSGADALLLALTPPTVAPVAPPAGKYVPAVGDVCRYVNDRDGSTFVITLVDADGVRWKRTGADNAFQVLSTWPEDIRFVRDSTDAEKRAAGLAVPPPAPTPAPEAKRPTHVRVTKIGDNTFTVTVGRVYEVVRWYDDGGGAVSPQVMADDGELVELAYVDHSDADYCPSWEPAPCPPPVAGRGERPEIVCLCGSTRFMDAYAEHYGRLTDEGKIVLSVGRVVPQSEQALGSPRKAMLDELHLRKIDLADRIFVLNVGGYIGSSTKREIEYARAHGKPVTWLESPGSAS